MFLSFFIMLKALLNVFFPPVVLFCFLFIALLFLSLFMSVSPWRIFMSVFLLLSNENEIKSTNCYNFCFHFISLLYIFKLNWGLIKVLTKKVITIKINKTKKKTRGKRTAFSTASHRNWVINFYETLFYV